MIGRRIYSGAPFEEMAGYARAVIDPPYVFVSGTTGFDPETLQFPEDVEAQCENCFRIIERALSQAGSSLENMIRVRVFVVTRAEFERIKPIIKRHCDAARPANTTILTELAEPYMRVEIEVTAKIDPTAGDNTR
ncbi:MAG: RidA family protein [Thalassobaculaceae bacterium]|nr:RidA family protein [Thalassobaculaceae bacterium]